jgi:hypothetical protein
MDWEQMERVKMDLEKREREKGVGIDWEMRDERERSGDGLETERKERRWTGHRQKGMKMYWEQGKTGLMMD